MVASASRRAIENNVKSERRPTRHVVTRITIPDARSTKFVCFLYTGRKSL